MKTAKTIGRSSFPSSRPIRSPRRCEPRRKSAREVIFLEPDSAERPHLPDTYPDTYAVRRIGLDPVYRGVSRVAADAHGRSDGARLRHGVEAARRRSGSERGGGGGAQYAGSSAGCDGDSAAAAARGVRSTTCDLLNPHPDCLAEITIEFPYLAGALRILPAGCFDGRETTLDRPRVQLDLLREAEGKYTTSTGEKLAHWQRRMIARYTRNLAHISGDLMASVYDLAVAARSVVDDNYGWEVWQMANRYLAQHETSDLETVRLNASEIWINTKRLRIRRRLPRPKQRLKPAGLKPRKREKFAGEWAQQTTGEAICSYPPEDLVIEEYGRFREAKGQGDSLRGARARGAVHHFDPGRHRHSRDHPQLAPAQDFCEQSGPAGGRSGLGGGDFR